MNASYSESDMLFSDQEVTNYQSTTWDMFFVLQFQYFLLFQLTLKFSASKQSLKG